MENRDRTQNQGGRNEPRPGTDDDRDIGTDPRRTREQDEERENQRRNPSNPGQPGSRPDQGPKVG
jgi:hypothetical protein